MTIRFSGMVKLVRRRRTGLRPRARL